MGRVKLRGGRVQLLSALLGAHATDLSAAAWEFVLAVGVLHWVG